MRRVQTVAALLTTLLLWSGAAWAQGSTPVGYTRGAQVYELTETARLIAKRKTEYEVSVSAMMGFVRLGTPLCPAQQFATSAPGTGASNDIRDQGSVCVVTITGSNTVDLTTGLGPISGTFKVVLPDPVNPHAVDAPELVVMKGSFDGSMDFSPAVLSGVPYGTVTGVLQTDSSAQIPFVGVFVMPFDPNPDPTTPNLCNVANYAANNLGSPGGNCYLQYALTQLNPPVVQLTGAEIVRDAQKSLGYPTARFDIYFQQ